MKRTFWGILLLIAFVGCQTDNLGGIVGVSKHQLSLSLPANARTSLGEKQGDIYPLYWSEGDCIVANGVASQEISINETNPALATFEFATDLEYPLSIVYPYTSSTTADTPKVTFLAEQSYEKGTFARGSAPMCGYAEGESQRTALKHLATILRFSVKAQVSDATLQSVVVSSDSGEKLSGEFAVNCATGAIAPTATTGTKITYSLPNNFLLSNITAKDLFISVPSGIEGDFKVEFVESSGSKMVGTWRVETPLSAGKVKEFEITYKRNCQSALTPLEIVEDEFKVKYPEIYGYVKDSSGKPIKGVAVSDGFSVVATNANGYYKLKPSTDAWYIFITVPAEYEIPIDEIGQPCFYTRYPTSSPQFDFTLTPLAGGKEKKFALFSFGDTQVGSEMALGRFQKEAVPAIKKHCEEVKASGIPCYGITLGDIISNNGSRNVSEFREPLRDGFLVSQSGMPVFHVMGNHDYTYYYKNKPIFADEDSSTYQLKIQRDHETIFGPVNYSFDRGDVHIVGMRNIVFSSNLSAGTYEAGFLPSQYEWLKQDLALVPKDKMVVLCVHIQMLNRTTHYTQEVLSLLDKFREAHILSGHSHIQHIYEHEVEKTSHKVFEHNACAICGAWWSANIAGDGTPNGYNVWIGEGNTFTDWYYMGYNKGMNTRATSQIRLYRGNAKTGAEKSGTDTYGVKGYYQFNFADDVLLANVFNADSQWVIKVYENGVHTGNMTKLTHKQPLFANLTGEGTYANPYRPTTETGHDYYVTGLMVGILGRYDSDGPLGGAYASCYHMYKYKLKNKSATIKVEAIDRFGNKYTETKITEGTDYSLIRYNEN